MSGTEARIAVVTALPAEADAVQKHLTTHDATRRITTAISVTATGAGKTAAAEGITRQLSEMEPTHLICGGIAGSLTPRLAAGDCVTARRCWYYDRDATALSYPLGSVTPNGPTAFDLPRGDEHAHRMGWSTAVVATGDSIVTAPLVHAFPPPWRERLAESDLVDMESAVWAEIALRHGIEPLIVRTVYDTVFQPEARRVPIRDAFDAAGRAIADAIVAVCTEIIGSEK